MNQVSLIKRNCEQCGTVFEFEKTRGRPRSKCSECRRKNKNATQQKWAEANRERYNRLQGEWRGRNREEERARRKEIYWADPEKGRESSRRSVAKFRKEKPERQAAINERYWTPSNRRKHNLRNSYNMTEVDYELMLLFQGNKCKICGESNPKTKSGRFNIDHCHETGRIRGLLCNPCNVGLGTFTDDVSKLEAAIRYLNEASMGATA